MAVPRSRCLTRAIAALALAALVPAPRAGAQDEVKPFPKSDPYTKGVPEALEKAGYVSYGPFRFGDDHTTDQATTTLGGIPLIWVETKHFKLGSGLPEYTISSDKQEKEHLKAELERLAERLPDVKPGKIRKLDPWLRLHLYAQRLEELYSRFLSEFGLQEGEFPKTPQESKQKPGPYMGEGMYLGMPGKYAVLLLQKKSSVGRYATVYFGKSAEAPSRLYFPTTGAWLFITSQEFLDGDYANDMALACDVMAGVSQNLASGFRGYRVALPFSVGEGIAHWFSREFDPRYHMFAGTDLTKVRLKDEWNWGPSVRARVEHKVFPSTSDMLGWADPDALEWADHLVLWSRIDYLLSREDGVAGTFLRELKEPPTQKEPLSNEQLAERARKALEKATGGDLARFDTDWGEWVLRTYPKK